MNYFMELQLHEQQTRREWERHAGDPLLRAVLAADLATRRVVRAVLSFAARAAGRRSSRASTRRRAHVADAARAHPYLS
jgi:hypothetical protein